MGNPDLEAAGLKYLARREYGFRTYTRSKRQINTPADFKGLNIRTPPDFVNQETVKALGGMAQTIAIAIALTAVLFFIGLGRGGFLAMLPQRMYSGTAGFVPGVPMGVAMMIAIALMAKPRGLPRSRTRRPEKSSSAARRLSSPSSPRSSPSPSSCPSSPSTASIRSISGSS
jgi:TRAP-type C4-dicarboxylate transport system, periplasmic component